MFVPSFLPSFFPLLLVVVVKRIKEKLTRLLSCLLINQKAFEDEGGESCVLIGPLDEVQFPRKSLTRYLFSHNPSDPDSLYWSTPSSSSSAYGPGSSSRKRSKKRSKSTSHKQTDSRTAKALERRQKLVAEGGML